MAKADRWNESTSWGGWGPHGDIIEVTKNGVTAIETVDSTPHICVTVIRNGITSQYAFREWVTGTVAQAELLPGSFKCEHCGKTFKAALIGSPGID